LFWVTCDLFGTEATATFACVLTVVTGAAATGFG
jgi:hypothetical protein